MSTPAPPPAVTSASAVAAQLTWSAEAVADAERLATLQPTVDAVNELVARIATAGPASRALGATMLAARLWHRRNSPEGVATFSSDGPVYVQRNDPDVAMLLGIGQAYTPPVVG